MTNNWLAGIILLVIIGLVAIWMVINQKKRRWYKVYTADNNCYLLYRDWNERMWRSNSYYLRFKDESNHEYTFPAQGHWVLMMVSVDDDKLDVARQEIENMNKIKAEAEL